MSVYAEVCMKMVDTDSSIKAVFDKCSRSVHRKHRDTLQAATGYLFGTGFLDSSRHLIRISLPQDRTHVLDTLVDNAVSRLSTSGLIVVPGWWTLAYWVFRWVVLPYLYDLLAEYAQSDVPASVVVSSVQH